MKRFAPLAFGLVTGFAWTKFITQPSWPLLISALVFTACLAFVLGSDTRPFQRVIRRWAVRCERDMNPFETSRLTDAEIEQKIFGDVVE